MLEIGISITIMIIFLIVMKFIMGINIKKIKELSKKDDLDVLTKELPDSETMTKEILKMLKNETVKVRKAIDEKAGTRLYIVLNNTIILGNMENKYARVQTIAHECLHSIQSKKLLWFNYIYSNLYIIYFWISIILTLLKVFNEPIYNMHLLILLGLVWYVIRSYLETDAMTKAPFLAKEYLEEKNISKENIETLIDSYNEINEQSIPATNYGLIAQVLIRCIVYAIIVIIIKMAGY